MIDEDDLLADIRFALRGIDRDPTGLADLLRTLPAGLCASSSSGGDYESEVHAATLVRLGPDPTDPTVGDDMELLTALVQSLPSACTGTVIATATRPQVRCRLSVAGRRCFCADSAKLSDHENAAAFLRDRRMQRAAPGHSSRPGGFLTHLFVELEVQAKGIGRGLLQRAFPNGRRRHKGIIALQDLGLYRFTCAQVSPT